MPSSSTNLLFAGIAAAIKKDVRTGVKVKLKEAVKNKRKELS